MHMKWLLVIIFTILNVLRGFNVPLIKKERIVERRRLAFPMDNVVNPKVSDDYFYAVLRVGEPKNQRIEVVLSTASELSHFGCKETCMHCGRHDDNPYSIEDSTSFNWISCDHELCSTDEDFKLFLQRSKRTSMLLRRTKQYGCLNNYKNSNKSVCKWTHKYRDASRISAAVGSDLISFYNYQSLPAPDALSMDPLTNETKIRLVFGCSEHESNTIYNSNVDGVMGLSMNHRSFFQQLFENDNTALNLGNKQFAHCFGIETGGILLFGSNEVDDLMNQFSVNPKWSELTSPKDGFYRVNTTGFIIMDALGNQVNISYEHDTSNGYGESMINTGATTLSMPRSSQKAIMDAILKLLTAQVDAHHDHTQFQWVKDYTRNYDYFLQGNGKKIFSDHDWNIFKKKYFAFFPDIIMWWNGKIEFKIQPELYLVFKNSHICLDIFGDTQYIIIGSNVMLNKFMIYDAQNMKVGIADFNCDALINRSTTTEFTSSNLSIKTTIDALSNIDYWRIDVPQVRKMIISDFGPLNTYYMYLIAVACVALLICCIYWMNEKTENNNTYKEITINTADIVNDDENDYIHNTDVMINQKELLESDLYL